MKSYVILLCFMFTNALVGFDCHNQSLHDWEPDKFSMLSVTNRAPSRTAVLIIAPPVNTNHRWLLGKKTWEQYMNCVPDVDCYFIQSTVPREGHSQDDQIWIEDNTIYIGDIWYQQHKKDRILYKTIVAIEKLLPYYTHFIRTNLNTFLNLKIVKEYTETHHQSMFTGPLWQKEWYVLGYGVLFTADVATHMVNEYRRLENQSEVSHRHADDCVMTSLATGIYPLQKDHPFRCSPNLPCIRQIMCPQSYSATRESQYGLLLCPPPSFEEAINYCKKNISTTMLYRIREGYSLENLADLYTYLIVNIYPEITMSDLNQYVKSLQ